MNAFHLNRISVVVALIWIHAGPGAGNGLAGVEGDKKVEAARIKFPEKVSLARKHVLSTYDQAIAGIKKTKGLTAAAKQDKLDRWLRAKTQFERSSTFPAEDEFAGMELGYFLAVNNAFAPVAKAIDNVIEKESKASSDQLSCDGRQMKKEIEQELLGTNNFTSHSRWFGTFDRPGGTIPYHLYIGAKGDGGTFKGHVEDNPGVQGNWAYDIEGQTSGLAVEYVMTKSIRGGFVKIHVTGIVSGDRLIAKVTQKIGGSTHSGLVVLHRQ